MKDSNQAADAAFLEPLGRRLAAQRVARNLTQAQLAEEAGVGVRTIQRLEAGAEGTHLSGFIRVCRVLGLLDQLDALIQEPPASPIAQLKSRRQTRKRASPSSATPTPAKKWTWDDQT